MFRRQGDALEVLLVHPGGPYFRDKDHGFWTIPKGEIGEGEDPVSRARTEFEEELGIAAPAGKLIEIGLVKQKGGKTVHALALQGDLPNNFKLESNTFEMEWPPHSGKTERFPEVDRVAFFPIELVRTKINPAQKIFVDRLISALA